VADRADPIRDRAPDAPHKLRVRVTMVSPSPSKIGEGENGNLQRYPVERDETYVGGRT